MFNRNAIEKLNEWKAKKNRKPLIIRGARQVGKTSLVNIFSKSFEHYIYLNLDIRSDLDLFPKGNDINKIIQQIFLRENIPVSKKENTLLFIDEIQNSPEAVGVMRYFYEFAPELAVVAAGSLLESIIDNQISFPVGRVEFLVLRPVSFQEFVLAKGEEEAWNLLNSIPFPDYGHQKLLSLFKEYTLIGGMPEVVNQYIATNDVVITGEIFQYLITTYLDDVEKYSTNQNDIKIIRHIIQNVIRTAGERIKFAHYGDSNYSSKEVSESFRTLEKALLLQIVYPTTQTNVPILENKRKSPKIQFLDTGIINYFAGIQSKILSADHIDEVYEGKIAEHIVGQELLSANFLPLSKNYFWVREKKQSNAEIDFIIQHNSYIIPIEVKLGKTGRLRSLMEFMDICPHNFAIRIYSGELKSEKIKTINGKEFQLLNLPFYLTSKIKEYINHYF